MEYEYEAKGLVTQEQFERLLENLGEVEHRSQTNIYFETNDMFFRNHNCGTRIRVLNDTYQLTCKIREASGNQEWNTPLTKEEADQIFESKSIDLSLYNCPFEQKFTDLNVMRIHTERSVCDYKGTMIELDVTDFEDTRDFEIEIEAENLEAATKLMAELASEFDLDIKKSQPKIARYYMYNN